MQVITLHFLSGEIDNFYGWQYTALFLLIAVNQLIIYGPSVTARQFSVLC